MTITLYGLDLSPVVRGTLLTLEALGLQYDFKTVNTLAGEQLTPEFLKLNPLHTIPTIQDGDFVIWDSHAINAYLVDKYGKDDALYPKDLQKRAVVNQRLYYDTGVIFPRIGAALSPIFRQGAKTVTKELGDPIIEVYKSLETLLDGNNYIAGNQVTIADFSIVATVSTANLIVPIVADQFPKITEWLSRAEGLPYYASGNQVGLDKAVEMFKSKLA